MNLLVIGIVVLAVLLFVVGAVLSAIFSMSANALRAIGETASGATVDLANVVGETRLRIAQWIGRAGQEGREVEVFQPALSVALPTQYKPAQLEAFKKDYRAKVPALRVPQLAIPTFPEVPDVLQVPNVEFTTSDAEQLDEHLIPTLFHGRSDGCTVPTAMEHLSTPEELDVACWTPPHGLPERATQVSAIPLVRQAISLKLPLYSSDMESLALRQWLAGKLNNVVRAVHLERIVAFQEEKARIQQAYDEAATQNAVNILRYKCQHTAWEALKSEVEAERTAALAEYEKRAEAARHVFRTRRSQYERQYDLATKGLAEFWRAVSTRAPEAVCRLFDIAMTRIATPRAFPRDWVIEYDAEQGILILDLRLPDFDRITITRKVALKRETKTKPVTARQKKQLAESASCLYLLRALHEVVMHDLQQVVRAVAVNGWVEYVDATTGRDRSVVIISIFANMEQLRDIDISRVDPVQCINSLGGRFAGIQHGYVAIAPIVRLNRHDDRVIEGSDVLSELATGTNLAAMEWDKFEHLIRQLFERVFSGPEIEVKVTRASRDRGVDAIIFDPDPIRGGKTVIQAKRYVNTVDLSAVRDLYGTVVNEGANKGILVTTSSFGADAYEFSKDKNLTLLTGRELLGLLEDHGYHYRIDLEEARRLNAASAPGPRSNTV